MMEESAPDVLLGQGDSSLVIGLCASLPSGEWHQNQGSFILGLHLAQGPPKLANPIFGSHLTHLHNTADKYLGLSCAKVVRQQSLTALEEAHGDR